jgi:serine/threonine protein phosphatase PrpC
MIQNTTHPWQVFGYSVAGATHLRQGAPNQDAIDWLATYGGGRPLTILVLADGHGGPRYIRSDVGARLAVQAGRTLLADLGDAYFREGDLAAIQQFADHDLPRLLVRAWQQLVDDHLACHPINPEALANLTTEGSRSLQQNPRLAYGATLVATLATADFLLYLQLGDGDLLVVEPDGRARRPSLPVDANNFGNATTSFCLHDAWRYVRSYFQSLGDQPPALILLATDGYANSFVSEGDFLLAAEEIYTLVSQNGRDGQQMLRRQLPGWLRATSDQGSGDDITVGVLYRSL